MLAYDITNYGARADGSSDNTLAINEAITQCAQNGGGTVYVPAGTYLTGPIQLKDNITLYLESGALLLFTDNFSSYPPVPTRWSGYECHGFSPLIYGNGLHHVAIKGHGVIDGQGKAWWDINRKLANGENYTSKETDEIARLNQAITEPKNTNIVEWESQFLRPPLLQLIDCERVTIEGVTLQNSPFWNTHLVYCHNANVHNVTIKNPSDTPNGDGLDIDSCSNVRVSDSYFDVGDDCLCLKSGINEDGRRVGKPSENITVTNCTMLHGHGGIVMGSESSGGIERVTVSNCVFVGTDRGIRLKTNRARGSYMRNILVNNIMMEGVFCPLAINSFYRYGVDKNDTTMIDPNPIPVSEKTPVIEHIQVSNVTARNCRAAAGFIYGLPEMRLKDIKLHHVTLEMTQDETIPGGEPDMVRNPIYMAGEGMFCKYVEGLILDHVRIETRQGPAVSIESASDVEVNRLTMKQRHTNTPVVKLTDVEAVYVNGNHENEFVEVEENSSEEVTIY